MSSGSLRDQLKALGLSKPKVEVERAAEDKRRRPPEKKPPSRPAQASARPMTAEEAEISLARAYAARQAAEKADAAELKRQQEEKARQKRERKNAAVRLLEGKSLAKAEADLPRHFEYGKKIRRIYVDAEQLQLLNRGAMGVAQMDGRFTLVDRATIDELHRIAPEFVALRVDPVAPPVDDFPVPDDLHW
jgi:uncharacterized protein YaiL (DUF2058 family)